MFRLQGMDGSGEKAGDVLGQQSNSGEQPREIGDEEVSVPSSKALILQSPGVSSSLQVTHYRIRAACKDFLDTRV